MEWESGLGFHTAGAGEGPVGGGVGDERERWKSRGDSDKSGHR